MAEYGADISVTPFTVLGDLEPHIVIRPDRTVVVPEELRKIAVQFDHNIETVTFDCPRYWDEHDLSEMHIYVHYRRPDGKTNPYPCKKPTVDEEDDTIIHFKWTISDDVTAVRGPISFLVVAKNSDINGVLANRWNSRLNQEMEVLEGLDCDFTEAVERYPDVIEHILLRLDNVENYDVGESGRSVRYFKALEQPDFANTIKECTDVNKAYVLPDGYIYTYGKQYVKQYTNIFPTLTDETGKPYNGVGYKDNVRIHYNTGEEEGFATYFTTGFIPFTVNDIFRARNVPWDRDGNSLIHIYDSDKKRLASPNSADKWIVINEENGDLATTASIFEANRPSVAYLRLSIYVGEETPDFDSMIMTLNEEIIEGEFEGFYNTGLAYLPADNEGRIIQLEEDVKELKEKGGGGNVVFDYAAYGLPELALKGKVSGMSKDNAVTLTYVYDGRSGTCTCKWQGSSSIGYPKKNYTIKFDNAFEAFEKYGEQEKYCFKANYIDHSHARNIICAKLWGDIVRSRRPENATLEAIPNCGAIDGFPCVITINGEYQGLYTFNIPKDGWMFKMGNGANEAIICAENDTKPYATRFESHAVIGKDFSLEYAQDEDNAGWVQESLNQLIDAINTVYTDKGANMDSTLSPYLDLESAIDYYIFTTLVGGLDMTNKNYLLVTYDGRKWFFSAYDMDSTFGLWWNGTRFNDAGSYGWKHYKASNLLMYLICTYKGDAVKARYKELRNSAMSERIVIDKFTNFVCGIPERIYLSDTEVWPTIPSSSASNLAQITSWYQERLKVLDAKIETITEELSYTFQDV